MMVWRRNLFWLWVGLTLWTSPLQAGSEQDVRASSGTQYAQSLADRVPAVSGTLIDKSFRVELTPRLSLSFSDPFFQHLSLGADVNFHLSQSWSLGVMGQYFQSFSTPVVVVTGGEGGQPNEPDYDRPAYGVWGKLAWAPIYGKMSLFSEIFLHFDCSLAALIGVLGTAGVSTSDPVQPAQLELSGGASLLQRFFLSSWLFVTLGLDVIFYESSRQASLGLDRSLQVLIQGVVGVGFFLPFQQSHETKAKHSG
jgi:outer membrane beta-barrel protein